MLSDFFILFGEWCIEIRSDFDSFFLIELKSERNSYHEMSGLGKFKVISRLATVMFRETPCLELNQSIRVSIVGNWRGGKKKEKERIKRKLKVFSSGSRLNTYSIQFSVFAFNFLSPCHINALVPKCQTKNNYRKSFPK